MLYVLILTLIIIIFRNWFTFLPISSGDLGFFLKEHIIEYLNPPFMWETFRNLGFGGNSFLNQGVYLYNVPMGLLGRYFDYGVIERIIWFYPILILGFLSPLALAKIFKITPSQFFPFAILIYLFNTYFFMTMGGGQLTVVAGYLAIPLVFAVLIYTLNQIKFYKILLFSLLFSLLVAFDFRYAYIFLIISFIYAIFNCFFLTSVADLLTLVKKYFLIFFFSFLVVLGTHAFWLLPYITHYHSPTSVVTSAYTSAEAVKYFSFATFENSFSLLHPYWPENIFGKVGFMKPEFLILPILAYSSLIFIKKLKLKDQTSKLQLKAQRLNDNLTASNATDAVEQFQNRTILFFALLGLIGGFLGKGAKAPFGELYIGLFDTIPGFFMFRDSTKWYTLIAISYSVLVPFTIWKVFDWIKSQPKFQISNFKFQIKSKHQILNVQNLFLILTTLYLILLIRPAIMGEVGGTLKPIVVPKEYIEFKNFLLKDDTFYRVLWVPTLQRFTFYSNNHPAVYGQDFFNTWEEYGVITALQKQNAKELLQKSAIKYVVVPDDTQKEIFLNDRKYDEKEYTTTVEMLKQIPWLRKTHQFGRIVVFELDDPKDHFWSSEQNIKVASKFINPTQYTLSVQNAKENSVIIFSESFDKNWQAKFKGNLIKSEPYAKLFNSFRLPKDGSYLLTISYKPQEWVQKGLIVSISTVVIVCTALLFLYITKKKA